MTGSQVISKKFITTPRLPLPPKHAQSLFGLRWRPLGANTAIFAESSKSLGFEAAWHVWDRANRAKGLDQQDIATFDARDDKQ